jgi:hypothetical protein
MAEAHGPYAQSLRQKLAKTTDIALLTGTSTWVTNWALNHYLFQKFDFDILALADSLNNRALEIEPTNHTALATKVRLYDVSTNLRLRSQPFDKLNRTDRITVLRNSIQLWSVANKPDEVEAKARQLLELAMQDTRDSQYADAIYAANIALGYIALQKGDKTQASQYLLAAVDAPPSDRLRISQIDMTLARQLVDWGEREAVAQFLEKCANFNWRGKELSDWAANIRKGINPDLKPYQSI